MSRSPIPCWRFSVVLVKRGRRVLLVHEARHGRGDGGTVWYLPAGRVEEGETFAQGAHRETLEEAGVAITLEGILRLEHDVFDSGLRMRVIYLARPATDDPPKSEPDEESLEARWVTLEEAQQLPLRSPEVTQLMAEVLGGAPIAPLSILVER